MSNLTPPQDNSKSSLQGAFKKRKTQEIDRLIEARRTGSAPVTPPASETPRTSQTVNAVSPTPIASTPIEPQRFLPTANAAPTVPDEPGLAGRLPRFRFVQALTPAQRKRLIIVMSIGLIILLAVGGVLLSSTPHPAATMVALPVVSAQAVIDHLKSVGLPLTNIHSVTTDTFWKAKQAIQFDVQRGSDTGSFLALSYDSEQQSSADVQRAKANSQYKQWETIRISNIIVAVAPETSPRLITELNSHLTQYLVAPYFSFLPTSTLPVPSATP